MATVNYVRFIRGTPTAFTNLSKKDPDTLYLISEKDATVGSLYLGEKLISGISDIKYSLKDLTDLLLDNDIDPESILVYDDTQNKWINEPFSEVFDKHIRVMTGATETTDGESGYVPQPKTEDYNRFLRGDGTWVDVSEAVGEDYTKLKNTVSTLVGTDEEQSVRQIAVTVLKEELIPDNATLDSLEKISHWIQSHSSEASNLTSRIEDLESDVYGTYDNSGNLVVQGLTTKVGNLTQSLKQLTASIGDVKADVEYNTTQIGDLYERLKWQDMPT